MSSFPYKLHQLLTDVEDDPKLPSSVIQWLPCGKGFRLLKPQVFEEVLLSKYFPRQSKLKSFKRQVQYYGFENLGGGGYAHPYFVRGQRNLCGKIMHKLPTKNQKVASKSSQAIAEANEKTKAAAESLSKLSHATNILADLQTSASPPAVVSTTDRVSSASSVVAALGAAPAAHHLSSPVGVIDSSIANKIRCASIPLQLPDIVTPTPSSNSSTSSSASATSALANQILMLQSNASLGQVLQPSNRSTATAPAPASSLSSLLYLNQLKNQLESTPSPYSSAPLPSQILNEHIQSGLLPLSNPAVQEYLANLLMISPR